MRVSCGRCRCVAAAIAIVEARLTARAALGAAVIFGGSRVLSSLGATLGSLWKDACNTGPLTSLAACAFSRAFDLLALVLVARVSLREWHYYRYYSRTFRARHSIQASRDCRHSPKVWLLAILDTLSTSAELLL